MNHPLIKENISHDLQPGVPGTSLAGGFPEGCSISKDKILQAIFDEFHHEPAWLSNAVEFFSLTQDDEDRLNDMSDSYNANMKAMESGWRKTTSARVSEFVAERKSENPIWFRKRRMDYLRDNPEPKNIRQLRAMENRSINEIPPEMIERARAFPLENLVGDELKFGRMKCPIHHGEDRNFVVKNGYGFCFVCNKSIDSIGYLMSIRGMTFRESVEALQ